MKKFYHSLILAFFALIAGTGAVNAEDFTVTSIKAVSTDGGNLAITFSEDIKTISHSMFGTRCLTFLDSDGSYPTTPQNVGNPSIEGNKATFKGAAGGNFEAGHHIKVTLVPSCFTSVSGQTLTGTVEFDVIVDEGEEMAAINAVGVTPTPGTTRTSLYNITAHFEPTLTAILNPELITVENENGHKLKLTSVQTNSEAGAALMALNINLDTDNVLEEGTTYYCHLAPGAIEVKDLGANTEEIKFGAWYVRVTPIQLITTPATYSVLESIKTVVVDYEKPLELVGSISNIAVRGVMEYQVNVYATCESATKNQDGSYTLTFDKEVTPEMLAKVQPIRNSSAATNSVKIQIPEGTFKSGKAENANTDIICIVQEYKPIGELTWTFDPAAGSTLESLGKAVRAEDENGVSVNYQVSISVKGDNAFVLIPDASAIKLCDANGATVTTFAAGDIISDGENAWSLNIGKEPKASSEEYTLIIPKESIKIYNNKEFYGEPVNPAEDVEATWNIQSDGISTVETSISNAIYTLQGIKIDAAQKGIYIINGKKIVR